MRRAVTGSGLVTALTAVALSCLAQTAGASVESAPFGPPVEDERVYVHGLLDQFEDRMGSGEHVLRWEGQGWAGTDENRLWLKSEGFLSPGGKVSDGMHEALYDRPLSTYFDLQAGLRYDVDSDPSRAWGALGIQGLAPQWFNIETTLFVSDGGHLGGRVRAAYELLFTQRLILEPEVEIDAYGKSDPARAVGAGFSTFEAGLRLRYEACRKFAPYVGVTYRDSFGATVRFAHQRGEATSNVSLIAGIRAWF